VDHRGGGGELGSWLVILDWDHPYDGIEIRRTNSGLQISIPFDNELSANLAVAEMQVSTRQENPVITGSLIGDDDDQDEDGRVLPGSGAGPGRVQLSIEQQRG
jgi:hypothetical protein